MSTPFAAVLLAGGRSQRMGSDKALLTLPDGRRLWERQRDILAALEPAEWFLSGTWRPGFPPGLPWLEDRFPGSGPLAGIAAALEKTSALRLVVLAVDLPMMTARFLLGLLQTDGHVGAVPWQQSGFYEPLAAVYPKLAATTAEEHLRKGLFSLQPFVRALAADGLVSACPVAKDDSGLFTNWNHPTDLA